MNTTTKKKHGKSSSSTKVELSSLITQGQSAFDKSIFIIINKEKLDDYLDAIPETQIGDWSINTEIAHEMGCLAEQVKCMTEGMEFRLSGVKPGDKVKRLMYKDKCMMSPTVAELSDHYDLFCNHAEGNILITGLGLGIIPFLLDSMPKVDGVYIYEKDINIINLVYPTLKANTSKVFVIQRDAFDGPIAEGGRYDYIWHDIWLDIAPDNLKEMDDLKMMYYAVAEEQGCWAEDVCEFMRLKEALMVQRIKTEVK